MEDVKIISDENDLSWIDAQLQEVKSIKYFHLYSHFVSCSEEIKDDGSRQSQFFLFASLAKACSLSLCRENEELPLVPLFNSSAGIDDFSEKELFVYRAILPKIKDFRLRARLADILWLAPQGEMEKHERFPYVDIAIEAYFKFPISDSTWNKGGKKANLRLIDLVLTIKCKDATFKTRIENRILTSLFTPEKLDAFFVRDLSTILFAKKIGKEKYHEVAELLCRYGDEDDNNQAAMACYECALKFYQYLGQSEKLATLYNRIAERYEKMARMSNPLFAQDYIMKAKAALRAIPKKFKTADIFEKIGRYDAEIGELRELAKSYSFESTCKLDITPLVIETKNVVCGLEKDKAIYALVSIAPICQKQYLIEQAIDQIKESPIQCCVIRNRFHLDGRLLEKYDGGQCFFRLDDEDNSLIQDNVFEMCKQLFVLYANAKIEIALKILHQEHRYSFADFLDICKGAIIIPPQRVFIFAKGLYAGYNYDYITAMHILAPQLEHLVRQFLKIRGVSTIMVMDANGKEEEKSLSSLIEMPEAKRMIGENLAFTISALFCNDRGPNIRNEIAHGLAEFTDFNQSYYVYAWWFILRLIVANQIYALNLKI